MANRPKFDAGDFKVRDYFMFDPMTLVANEDFNGRHFKIGDTDIDEMMASLKEFGQRQPISCRKLADGRIEVISGFTRFYAAMKIRAVDPEFKIKAMVDYNVNDLDALKMNTVENLDRNDLNWIDYAYQMSRYADQYGWSVVEITEFYGKGWSHGKVSLVMSLKGLPEKAQRAIAEKRIALSTARELLKMDEETVNNWLSTRLAKAIEVVEMDPDGKELETKLYPTPVLPAPKAVDPKPEPKVEIDPMTGAPKKSDNFDPKTGKATKPSAKAPKPKSGKKIGTAADLKEIQRKQGKIVKRSLADLREFFDARSDNVSMGITDFLDGSITAEELAKRLDEADDRACEKSNRRMAVR